LRIVTLIIGVALNDVAQGITEDAAAQQADPQLVVVVIVVVMVVLAAIITPVVIGVIARSTLVITFVMIVVVVIVMAGRPPSAQAPAGTARITAMTDASTDEDLPRVFMELPPWWWVSDIANATVRKRVTTRR